MGINMPSFYLFMNKMIESFNYYDQRKMGNLDHSIFMKINKN